MKKIIFFIGTVLYAVTYSGCESCDCPNVTEGTVKLNLTINSENLRVPIQVFKGSIEKGELMIVDTISDPAVSYILPAPGNYAATAAYKSGNDTVLTINGGRLSVTTDDCECDQGETLRLNMRLAR